MEAEIGSGGSAVVFLARNRHTGNPVAVKVLRPVFAGSELESRFVREIELLGRVAHPRIMPMITQGRAGSTPYYVMPYCGNETLRDTLMRTRQGSLVEKVRILSDLAEALDHVHRNGFVHRDVKPSNVMMVGERAILSDFGCAVDIDHRSWQRITVAGSCPGTPEYMSPEQFWDCDRIGVASDIYSLACVSFELLAGRTPFVGHDARTLAARHLLAAPLALSEHLGPAFAAADEVFASALAKDPSDRPESAQDFVSELGLALPPG